MSGRASSNPDDNGIVSPDASTSVATGGRVIDTERSSSEADGVYPQNHRNADPTAPRVRGAGIDQSDGIFSSPRANASSLSEVVALNVGGCHFTTSRSTLTSVPGSQLEAMFSGRHSNHALPAKQDDDAYFIDRDGSHFRHVLNFLRTGGCVVTLPGSDVEKQELAIEADYYGLEGLVKAIRMPKIDVSEHLSEEILAQREKESQLREAFVSGEAKRKNADPFQGLVPIFDPDDGIPCPIKFDPDHVLRKQQQQQDCLFMANACIDRKLSSSSERPPPPPPATVGSIEAFRTNFNKEWPNVLHCLDEIIRDEPVVLAGGCVLRALTASEEIRTGGKFMWGQKTSDIDVFVYARDAEEANRIARRIFYALAVDDERWVVIRSRGVVNIHKFSTTGNGFIEIKVQIVLRLYESPTEVLVGFDVDCCLCAYDGRNVWLAPRCISALESGVNVLNPLHAWPNRPSYEIRLGKYASRGFAVSVPGIDKKRIDYDSILKSKLTDLKGMARFIKVACEMETATRVKRYDWRQRTELEYAKSPRQVENLLEGELSTVTDDERVVDLRWEVSPVNDVRYDEVTNVVVPKVYWVDDERVPEHIDWTTMEDFRYSRDTRDAAWEGILDAGEDGPERVPRRLVDSWDAGKRSREYLNGGMDKFDLDNCYYSQAYYGEQTKTTPSTSES